MTRDFELIRSILFQVEEAPAGDIIQQFAIPEGMPEGVLGEHLDILIEAGLLEGQVIDYAPATFIIKRLTWSGHDFIAKARNDTIWKKVMAEAKEKGTSTTMHIIDGLLTKAAEKYAGLGGEKK